MPSDESFCQQWAGTSVDAYLKFRERLLLSDFAPKHERKAFKEPQRTVSGSSWRKEVVKSGYW